MPPSSRAVPADNAHRSSSFTGVHGRDAPTLRAITRVTESGSAYSD